MGFNHLFRRAVVPLTLMYPKLGGHLRRYPTPFSRHYPTEPTSSTSEKPTSSTSEKSEFTAVPPFKEKNHSVVQTICSEIERLKETVQVQIPVDFPFEIEDQRDLLEIKLFKKQPGEKIEVKVQMPELITEVGEAGELTPSSTLPLIIRISMISGSCLDFACTGYPNKICIDSLSLKDCDSMTEERRDIMVLEESSRKELVKYLELRGINSNTVNFLHEYMIKKDCMQHLIWLEKLKRILLEEDSKKVSPMA